MKFGVMKAKVCAIINVLKEVGILSLYQQV